jgi:hypothetical protein
VTIVSLQDSDAEKATFAKGQLLLLGDAIALFAAALYGCYTTLVKLRVKHESHVDMTLFFGFVGLFCLIFLWPFIIVLSVLGVEPFELPPSKAVTFGIIVHSLSQLNLGKYVDYFRLGLPVDSGHVDDISVNSYYGVEFEYTSGVTGRFSVQRSIEGTVLLVWSGTGTCGIFGCEYKERRASE